MRILYFSQYFPPEVGATQTRAYEMARGLVRAGHHVTMIAEVPNHPSGIIPSEYQGKLYERVGLDGIDVIRVWVKASPVKTFRSRMAFYLSYMVSATLAGILLARGRYDLIYATSPPLFVGGAALMLSLLRRIPLGLEVRDLWPESAIALGELSGRWAIALAEWLERACYRRARYIIVVTQGILDQLLARGIQPGKLHLVPNGTNIELFVERTHEAASLRVKLGLAGRFIAIYAGIHGIAQGLETLIEAARLLHDESDVHFLFVGEGPVKSRVMAMAQAYHLGNVTFHPEVPREQMPVFLSAADVALVPLRDLALFWGARPSKMFDAWACQCPTIVSVGGEARRVLEEAEAGLAVKPEDASDIARAILALRDEPDLRWQFGVNGRRYVEARYSLQVMAAQLGRILTAERYN
jgi:colanic acid biosynthesis glycosyl transferase WcaI